MDDLERAREDYNSNRYAPYTWGKRAAQKSSTKSSAESSSELSASIRELSGTASECLDKLRVCNVELIECRCSIGELYGRDMGDVCDLSKYRFPVESE